MISIQKNFLFIHVPKTGGNSIQNLLNDYSEDNIVCNSDCHDGVGRFDVRNKKHPFLQKHSNLLEYKKALPKDVYKKLFKFSVIRNPWDRMISNYFSPRRGLEEWDGELFKKILCKTPPLRFYVTTPKKFSFMPSCIWKKATQLQLYPAARKDLFSEMDFLLRFEQFEEDFKKLCKLIGIPYSPLPVRNKSNRKHYSYYYDDEFREMVRKRFSEEISLMNYEFEQA